MQIYEKLTFVRANRAKNKILQKSGLHEAGTTQAGILVALVNKGTSEF